MGLIKIIILRSQLKSGRVRPLTPRSSLLSRKVFFIICNWLTVFIDEHLWKLDLSKPFSARSPPWELEEKPSSPDEHYNGGEGTVWNVGMGTFTAIGGWFPLRHGPYGHYYEAPYFDQSKNFELPQARMFTYDAQEKKWSSVILEQKVKRISTASWVSNKRLRRGYVLGGITIIEKNTGPEYPYPITDDWLATMTQYDFMTKQWKTEKLPDGIGWTVDGGLIALDMVGEDGVLLFLGGEQQRANGVSNIIRTRRSMKTIWIYDIKTSTWYEQITTGETPAGRRQSCYFMAPAPDKSSFQIYTFSGVLEGTEDNATVLDLYVLTVPGFIWMKISLTDAGYPDNYPINAHQCSPYQTGRQILIVPGNMDAATNTTKFSYVCNNGTGVKIFDTLEWKFKSNFDPTLNTLGVPKPVADLVGGTTSGGAHVIAPRGGWNDSSLAAIFERRNEPISYADVNPNSNVTISPNDNSDAPSGGISLSKGTWAGIGVGALIALIGVCFLFFCGRCAFRKEKDEDNSRPIELYGQRDPVEAQGYVARHELSGGYQPPEHIQMQYQYQPKPNEYQQHLGQGHGHEDGSGLLPGAGPAGGAAGVPSPAGTMESYDQIHVHQQGVYPGEPPISYDETMQTIPYQGTHSPYQGVQSPYQGSQSPHHGGRETQAHAATAADSSGV